MSQTETSVRTEVRENMSVVGTRRMRYDANLKVSGAAVFGTDVHFPNLLHGKVLRSVYPHAKIMKLDVSKAERFPGVRAVVTADDFPDVTFGFAIRDQRCIAKDKVVFYGQPVCAVAADTVEIAERALAEVEVDYESLPNVLTIEDALKDDSHPLHPGVVPAGAPPYKSANVASFTRVHRGNMSAFKTADFVVEETYSTQQVHQGYIEPRATTASVDPATGKITVWTSTQSPFWVRNSLAEMLAIPPSKLQVIVTHTGGGFGAKISSSLEPFCVILSRKSRRPVRMVLTREEEFVAGTPRPAIKFWIKSAVKDGKIVARQAKTVVDAGAFASEGAVYANFSAFQLIGPYNIRNVETEGISVYTNKQAAGAFRAPGTAETAFAVESHTDSLAKRAGVDPVTFRMQNCWDDGSLGPTGQIMEGVGLKDALTKACKKVGWSELRSNPGLRRTDDPDVVRGVGVAVGFIPSVGMHSSSAYVKLNEDGRATLLTGVQDTGSGALTGLAMIVAEELGLRVEDVEIQSGDTDVAPWDGGSQGSRTTYTGGRAVLMAARDVRDQIINVAAVLLKTDKDKIRLKDGKATVEGTAHSVKYSEVAIAAQFSISGPIVGRGMFVRQSPDYDKSSVEGYTFLTSMNDPTFVAHAAVVEVNRATGKVRVVRYVAAQDLGRCINPLGAEGQIQGGVAQGIGYALFEEMVHDDAGFTTSTNFGDYKMPTIMDLPPIEPIIVEGHYGAGPYGAKGVGEGNIVPPAPAIANAVFDATGARVRDLPITPERVVDSLDESAPRATRASKR